MAAPAPAAPPVVIREVQMSAADEEKVRLKGNVVDKEGGGDGTYYSRDTLLYVSSEILDDGQVSHIFRDTEKHGFARIQWTQKKE